MASLTTGNFQEVFLHIKASDSCQSPQEGFRWGRCFKYLRSCDVCSDCFLGLLTAITGVGSVAVITYAMVEHYRDLEFDIILLGIGGGIVSLCLAGLGVGRIAFIFKEAIKKGYTNDAALHLQI